MRDLIARSVLERFRFKTKVYIVVEKMPVVDICEWDDSVLLFIKSGSVKFVMYIETSARRVV